MEEIDLDDAPWLAKTCWREAFLTSSAVASILDVQESTIRQYAAKAVPGFPIPARRESGRNYWTPDQVFRFIESERRQLMGRIPRLYCSQSSIVPAKFLFAERCTVASDSNSPMEQSSIDFAVHHWLPADGRGPIAVAYPGPPRGDGAGWKYAATLLAAIPSVDAVALVTDDVSIPYDHDGWQAAIGVAERGEPALEELRVRCPVRDRERRPVVAEWGWYELANLLRVDIPWWPALLRDVDQMVAWFPGVPRQRIRPRTSTLNESNLLGLVPRVPRENAAEVRELAVAMHRYLEGSDVGVLPYGDWERPGICLAAEPLYVLPEIPAMPDADTFRWLLELPVDDTAAADRATRALDAIPGVESVVANVLAIEADHHGQLASEWLAELIPVGADAATQLGFAFARRGGAGPSQPIVAHYKHRRDPHVWVVETRDDEVCRFHYTVGNQVPASGYLKEFELYETCAFFRDSNDDVWPLPILHRGCTYNSGYSGSGPQDLFEAVRILRGDAGADLTHMRLKGPLKGPLWNYIRSRKPPVVVTADELDEMIARPHR